VALHQRLSYTIPAAAAIANLLSGQGVEYIGRASMLDIYATADAAGDTFSLTQTVAGDQKVIVPAGTAINVAAATGAGPKMSEDGYIFGAPVPMGAHLILAILGTSTHTGRFALNIHP
jgi:hypothetical protein